MLLSIDLNKFPDGRKVRLAILLNELFKSLNRRSGEVIPFHHEIQLVAELIVLDVAQNQFLTVKLGEVRDERNSEAVLDKAGNGVIFLNLVDNVRLAVSLLQNFINKRTQATVLRKDNHRVCG